MRTLLALLSCVAIGSVQLAHAENLDDIFKKVNEYVAAKNYSKAMEELGWAQKELEKLHAGRLETLLPDTLGGLTGEKATSTSMLGMSQLERNYQTAGGATSVKVSLLGGSKGAGAAGGLGGLGGLAAMGQMAAMMGGNQPGTETFRVDGRTATLETASGSPSLTIFLEGGTMLKLEASGDAKADLLKKMAGEIKIAELESYLKG